MRSLIGLGFGGAMLLATFACGDDSTTGSGGGGSGASPTTTDGGGGSVATDCTAATATDMTGQAAVTITTAQAWGIPFNQCILVDVGTVVTWEGNFLAHPLIGGETPTADSTSPITAAGPGDMMTPVAVTFATAGEYPFFCDIHKAQMYGIVVVQ